jgi:hypothetical protein
MEHLDITNFQVNTVFQPLGALNQAKVIDALHTQRRVQL